MPGVSGTMSTWACSSCSIRKAHIGILQLPFFLQLEDASPTTHQATRQSKAYLLGTTCTLGLLFLPSLVSNPTNHPRPTWHLSHFPFSKPTLKVFPLKCGFWITSQRWSWTRCKQRGLKLQWWVFRPLAGEWGTGKGGRRTAGASWSLNKTHGLSPIVSCVRSSQFLPLQLTRTSVYNGCPGQRAALLIAKLLSFPFKILYLKSLQGWLEE